MSDKRHVERLLADGGYPTGKALLDAMLCDDDYDCGCGARERLLELRARLASHEQKAVVSRIPWGALVGLCKSFIRSCSQGEGRLLATEKLALALKRFHERDYAGVISVSEETGFSVEVVDDN